MSAITMDTVRDLIERHSGHVSGNAREFYNGAYAEIADELNAALGGDDNSRWHEMFGTPERAAATVAAMPCGTRPCSECPVFEPCDGFKFDGGVALAEWLRGDAE